MSTRTSDRKTRPLRPRGFPARAPAPWSMTALKGRGPGWTLEASNRFCASMVGSHYENFPVVSSLATRHHREALAAVYAFARQADDFADEPEFGVYRKTLLESWQHQLLDAFDGRADHPVFIALGAAVRRFDLPRQPFLDLVDAFRQDCTRDRYDTFDEVLDYCKRSANPVGRLVLGIFGVDNDNCTCWSDCICTALQLTNFLQDLSVDLPRNRVYLPLEDLDRFSVPLDSLLRQSPGDSFADLLEFQADRVMDLFRIGRPLMTEAGFPASIYVSTVWLGGVTVLRMVRETGPSILVRRPALAPTVIAGILMRAASNRLSGRLK